MHGYICVTWWAGGHMCDILANLCDIVVKSKVEFFILYK